MVMLYTCNACEKGDHVHCERSHVVKGHIGGRTCRCGCHGRSKEQWKDEEKNKWEAYKELLFSMEKRNKEKIYDGIKL